MAAKNKPTIRKRGPARAARGAADDRLPGPKPVPDQVEKPTDDTVIDGAGDKPPVTVSTLADYDQSNSTIRAALTTGQINGAFLAALRVWLRIVLMHLGLAPDMPQKARSPNADVLLKPGIECMLRVAPIIQDLEPRAFKGTDLKQVQEKFDQLPFYKSFWKLMKVGVYCGLAGVSNIEQYLDGSARKPYKHVEDLVATDEDMAEELEEWTRLVKDPSDKSVAARVANAKLEEELRAEIQAEQEPPGQPPATPSTTGTPPPSTPAGTPAPQTSPGTPSPPKSTGRRPKATGQSPAPRTPKPRTPKRGK